MTYSTADLYDQYGDRLQIADSIFNNYGGNTHFHGRIYTLKVPEDFLLIKQTLQTPGEQRVLVIDGAGSMGCALLGDRLAAMGAENNWAGVIINGCIRDSAVIATLPIGVKAINTCPARPAQTGAGELEVNLTFAGISFYPGDFVCADPDGIVTASEISEL